MQTLNFLGFDRQILLGIIFPQNKTLIFPPFTPEMPFIVVCAFFMLICQRSDVIECFSRRCFRLGLDRVFFIMSPLSGPFELRLM